MTDRPEELLTDSPVRRALILATTMMATSLMTTNITVVNVVLPQMQGDLSAGIEEVAWVVTAAIIAMAISMPMAGWVGNRFGGRQSVLAMTLMFTVSSAMLGPAGTLEEVIFWRFWQGAFGGLIPSLSMVLVLNAYPRRQHATALAIWAGGVMFGPIAGPTLGGYLSDLYSWRLAFLFMVPAGILTFAALAAVLPPTPKQPLNRLDWVGFLTLSVCFASVQLMFDRGNRLDWFESGEIILWAVLGCFSFYLFIVHSLTTRHPYIDLRIFTDRNFAIGCVFLCVSGALTFAPMTLLPTLLQRLRDVPLETIGLMLTPRGVGFLFGTYVLGALIRILDARLMLAVGVAGQALAFWYMAQFDLSVGPAEVYIGATLLGIAEGVMWTPLATITFSTLAAHLRGYGVAVFHSGRFFASGVGISITIAVLTRTTQANRAELNEHLTPFNEIWNRPEYDVAWNPDTLAGLARVNEELVRQATMIGYLNDFWMLMVAALLTIPLVVLLDNPRSRG